MRLSRALALLSCLWTLPASALPVTDCASLVASVAVNNSRIEIDGDIVCPSSLIVSGNSVSISGTGRIISGASGQPVAFVSATNFRVDGVSLWNEHGSGLFLNGAGRVYLSNLQINTRGHGIDAVNVAGLWLSGVHMNGLNPGTSSIAIIVRQWDTVSISDLLIEEHDTGLRLGVGGIAANIVIGNIVIDRSLIGFHIEPTGGGQVHNVMASNVWASGRGNTPAAWTTPLLLDTSGGIAATIRIASLYATGFGTKSLVTWTPSGIPGGGFSVGWQSHQ